MDQSTAATALLEAANESGPRTRLRSRTRDSSLLELPPSPAPPIAYSGSRRHVHFEEDAEAGLYSAPLPITPRSKRGKAPARRTDAPSSQLAPGYNKAPTNQTTTTTTFK